MACKKLIEVALPLSVINEGCLQEKNPFLKGHPRSLHLWWARRPLAAARAVLFAQLVDDPSSFPALFPTEKEQEEERKRLYDILKKIVRWENRDNEAVMQEARDAIKKSWERYCEYGEKNGDPELFDKNQMPEFHDPFAGGGGIPLEAQRLGLVSNASDLNPVAVLINKAMTELPYRFLGAEPVNPEVRNLLEGEWSGASGLRDDVRYYGKWMRLEAKKRIGEMYPPAVDESGEYHPVIAWIWARTMKCQNPACDCVMPLASTFVLSSKKGKEAWMEPVVAGQNVRFKIHKGKCPKEKESYKAGRGAIFRCPKCGQLTTDDYVKQNAAKGEMGMQLLCVVADSRKGRLYLPATKEQIRAAEAVVSHKRPEGELPTNPRWFSPPAFGMKEFWQLFTDRQRKALNTFCDLVTEAGERVIADGGSKAYAEAIETYLACGISQLARYSCTICGWNKTNENVAQAFGRQALPMVWDFAEANTLDGSLNIASTVEWAAQAIGDPEKEGKAVQADAQTQELSIHKIISTDPPYYDNIGYADLSDFFYVWLRQCLKKVYPDLFATMLVPKAEELVATPYRHGGKNEADRFFLDGMKAAMLKLARQAHPAFPVTIYYAFKQTDRDGEGTSGPGWETFLEAVLMAGFSLTGTWPVRTERTKGLKGAVNALASSIVLVCRKRSADAPVCTRRNFLNELKRELKPALKQLQKSNIAPVDLAQSAIGPGMAVFSKYAGVLEADGSRMSVRTALQMINQEIDAFFYEQGEDLDRDTRFCVELFTQAAFDNVEFGDADTLARAKNTSVASLAAKGLVFARKRVVHLTDRESLPERVDSTASAWLLCQQLTLAMERGGIEGCAAMIAPMYDAAPERAKDLAYRLYTIAERHSWAQEAYAYNAFVVSWPQIKSRAAALKTGVGQISLSDLIK